MIIELEKGVWLASGVGDPPRTLIQMSAREFYTMKKALEALEEARKYRPFKKAQIQDNFF